MHYHINFWSSASSSDATSCTAWYNKLLVVLCFSFVKILLFLLQSVSWAAQPKCNTVSRNIEWFCSEDLSKRIVKDIFWRSNLRFIYRTSFQTVIGLQGRQAFSFQFAFAYHYVLIISDERGKCFCLCLSVCLRLSVYTVRKITQKRVHGFGWNVACRQTSDMDELVNFWVPSGL